MGDFFQNGIITTLSKLGNKDFSGIEEELLEFSKRRNMVLLLPALYSEFENPAMQRIIEELKNVKYIHKIILGLDRASKEQFVKVKEIMSQIPYQVDILWNDGPRIQEIFGFLNKHGFDSIEKRGKGLNVWIMLGYALAEKENYAIALHDCDIVNYSREIPAKLFYPIVNPTLTYEFNKGYYSRVTNRLHGRVTRLFYTPLLKSIKKIFGENRYIEYLMSFRYALSGEFALIRSLARGIRISPTWGLEVSTLSEVYNNTSVKRICQTEIMQNYEHKHQALGSTKSNTGIARMANEIAQNLFRLMAQQGMVFTKYDFNSLFSCYFDESRYAISQYAAISKINGLEYDRYKEILAAEIFQESLKEASIRFLEDPLGVPALSSWSNVRSVLPDIGEMLKNAVKEDKKVK
ncbi:hypothetical protein [Nitrosophilus kaiyonis]|uniref:hypothetical protein n=1 Tax=Nitrosophilus kaiyonis TaxID=2930200 RepID=UPI002492CE77|nr:hypothetical protein [Nitrosophilus kaiyonis]